jgi:hypothetical protein
LNGGNIFIGLLAKPFTVIMGYPVNLYVLVEREKQKKKQAISSG